MTINSLHNVCDGLSRSRSLGHIFVSVTSKEAYTASCHWLYGNTNNSNLTQAIRFFCLYRIKYLYFITVEVQHVYGKSIWAENYHIPVYSPDYI